jgi:(4S)-4-hydroxy-5-phosphonooxypentane-2,3-dione isomerase
MYVVAVTIFVKPHCIEKFLEATVDNARHSRLEAGNVRFDVLQAEGEQNRFLLYEAYRAKEDFEHHHHTEHYLRWKETVTDYLAQPRQGVKHFSILFGEEESDL